MLWGKAGARDQEKAGMFHLAKGSCVGRGGRESRGEQKSRWRCGTICLKPGRGEDQRFNCAELSFFGGLRAGKRQL